MQFQNMFPVSSICIFANTLSDLVDDVIANNTFDDFLFFFNFHVMPFSYF